MTEQLKLNEIEKKLEDLEYKKVELAEQELKRKKTLYQSLFGQPALPTNPQLESVIAQIARLEKDKGRVYDVMQAAASVPKPIPEKDWSKYPLYWNRLKELGLISPAEQYNAYFGASAAMVGLGYGIRNFKSAYHLFKLVSYEKGTKEYSYHWLRTSANALQIEKANQWIGIFRLRGLAGLGPPLLFIIYLSSKHSKRI
jgi:hypothetical protein